MTDFSRVEKEFATVLEEYPDLFSSAETQEVRHFVDVGEYGLALETAIHILIDKKIRASPGLISQLERLAASMEMDCSSLIQQLTIRS
jgi:hypothetical protein